MVFWSASRTDQDIDSSISGHLSCFHLLAIVSHTALNMGVHLSLGDHALIFLDAYPEV